MTETTFINHTLHVDLSQSHDGETYWLHANGKRHELIEHTQETKNTLRSEAPHLASTPDEQLTHFTANPVPLPQNQVIRVHLKHSLTGFDAPEGTTGSYHSSIVQPPAGGDPDAPVHGHINWVSTAKALIFHHADLITHDPDIAKVIFNYMENEQESKAIVQKISDLATAMAKMGPPTAVGAASPGWATLTPVEIEKNGVTSTHYQQEPDPTIITAAGSVMTAMMQATKNDQSLKNKKWTQEAGVSVTTEPSTSSISPEPTMLASIDATGDNWAAKLTKSGVQNGLESTLTVTDQTNRTVNLKMDNTYLRYLGIYISFYDDDNNQIDISSWSFDSGIPGMSILENEYYRFLGMIQPINNFMAVPIFSDPGQLNYGNGVDITFPANAVSAKIFGCGLGTGELPFGKGVVLGGIMTGIANLTIPTLLMAFAVASNSNKKLYDLTTNPKVIKAAIAAGVVVFGTEFGISAAHKKMNWRALSSLSSIIFSVGFEQVLLWMEAQLAEGELEDEIPFAGWIVAAINIAVGVAQLAETITEVATSPWYIENGITLSIDSTITVNPDPRHQAWPQGQAGTKSICVAKMIYKDQGRPTVSQTFDLPANFTGSTIPFVFKGNTLGNKVKIEADFYIDDWLAGKAQSGWLSNEESVTESLTLYLVELPKPINSKSFFKHSSILSYKDSAYQWIESATVPTATIASLNAGSNANEISQCTGLSLSQRYAVLGQAWKSAGTGLSPATGGGYDTQLYALDSVNIPGRPMNDTKFISNGFMEQSNIVYDPYPPKFEMKDGNWVLVNDRPVPDPTDVDLGCYYIDPRKASISLEKDGGYHLRKIDVAVAGDIETNPSTALLSYGRFPFFPDHVSIHPSGHMIGINQDSGKVMILMIEDSGKADDQVPVASDNAGKALANDREGFLFRPIAVSCSYDGTILVLDQVFSASQKYSRIQAFDLLGRPVSCFEDSKGDFTSILPVPSSLSSKDITYLDLAVVGNKNMTYMFLLYYDNSGAAVTDYNVAVYKYGEKSTTSDMDAIVTTSSVPAARIFVDMWHTLYTQNYAMVEDGSGNAAGPKTAHTGPKGRTVTSISEWILPV